MKREVYGRHQCSKAGGSAEKKVLLAPGHSSLPRAKAEMAGGSLCAGLGCGHWEGGEESNATKSSNKNLKTNLREGVLLREPGFKGKPPRPSRRLNKELQKSAWGVVGGMDRWGKEGTCWLAPTSMQWNVKEMGQTQQCNVIKLKV